MFCLSVIMSIYTCLSLYCHIFNCSAPMDSVSLLNVNFRTIIKSQMFNKCLYLSLLKMLSSNNNIKEIWLCYIAELLSFFCRSVIMSILYLPISLLPFFFNYLAPMDSFFLFNVDVFRITKFPIFNKCWTIAGSGSGRHLRVLRLQQQPCQPGWTKGQHILYSMFRK